MRRFQPLSLLAVLLLLGSCIFLPSILAETPDILVEATMMVTVDSGSQLTVQAQMLVKKITVFDTTYDQYQIQTSAASDPIVLGAIMSRLHEAVKSQLTATYPQADVVAVTKKPSYQNPYFLDTFRVMLTPAFFALDSSMNLTNLLNGVLDMGAKLAYSYPLTTDAGWNTTYQYLLPATYALDAANTPDVTADNKQITWVLRNGDGAMPTKTAELSFHKRTPTTQPSAEDISLSFEMDTRSVSNVSLMTSIVMNAVNVQEYATFPSFISGLTVVPADGVRLLIQNGLFTWNQMYQKTINPIELRTKQILENSSFNQSVVFSFSWDPQTSTNCSTPYNITHMDTTPPVIATLQDFPVALRLCGISARAFFGLINAGSQAAVTATNMNFGDRLDQIGYPYTVFLQLPANITLAGSNRYRWNATIPFAGTFHSDVQPSPPYTDQKSETYIEIDLAKLDLNFLGLFTGKTELTATAQMREDDSMYVIQWPNEAVLPKPMNLTYLNADGFRLCVDESVFNDAVVTTFLSDKKTLFENHLSSLLQGFIVKGISDRKTFTNSLSWNGDISAMDDVIPVVTSVYASESYPVKLNLSLTPLQVGIGNQVFTVQGISNQTVTYRIIFPKGISVFPQDTQGKSLVHGNTSDGREYVELLFDPSESNVSTILTCALVPSPFFIIAIFLPCLFVFLLIIILIVAIYLVRKKRREQGGGSRGGGRKKKLLHEEEEEEPPEGFAGQDYYVPPPPSHKSKKNK